MVKGAGIGLYDAWTAVRGGPSARGTFLMNVHHPTPVPASPQQVSAERGTLLRTLVHLWPYIWPADRRDLKLRVVGALVLLLLAKLATITVPFTFKWATDALAGVPTAPAGSSVGYWLTWVLAAPVLVAAAYGATRITP